MGGFCTLLGPGVLKIIHLTLRAWHKRKNIYNTFTGWHFEKIHHTLRGWYITIYYVRRIHYRQEFHMVSRIAYICTYNENFIAPHYHIRDLLLIIRDGSWQQRYGNMSHHNVMPQFVQ